MGRAFSGFDSAPREGERRGQRGVKVRRRFRERRGRRAVRARSRRRLGGVGRRKKTAGLADRGGPPVSEGRWRGRLGRKGGRRWAGGPGGLGRPVGQGRVGERQAGWAEFDSRAEI
jgi:hypothetical protein